MAVATWHRLGVASAFVLAATNAHADVLADLASQCVAAIEAADRPAFEAAAEAIKKRQDTYNAEARKMAEDCLSEGYGGPWEYDYPTKTWLPSRVVEARLKADESAERAKDKAAADAADSAAQAEAYRIANAARVAVLVYSACVDLVATDLQAAMTNSVCVESFLANGLPPDLTP